MAMSIHVHAYKYVSVCAETPAGMGCSAQMRFSLREASRDLTHLHPKHRRGGRRSEKDQIYLVTKLALSGWIANQNVFPSQQPFFFTLWLL